MMIETTAGLSALARQVENEIQEQVLRGTAPPSGSSGHAAREDRQDVDARGVREDTFYVGATTHSFDVVDTFGTVVLRVELRSGPHVLT